MLNMKEDKKRIKEMEKQYGVFLVRVRTTEPEVFMRAVQKILGEKESPVWNSPFSSARCVESWITGNIARYELKSPFDTNATFILAYIQSGEWCEVFWELGGFKHFAETAKKGFAANFIENIKQVHVSCESQLTHDSILNNVNPPNITTVKSTTPPPIIKPAALSSLSKIYSFSAENEKLCPECSERLPPNAKFCNKCGQKIL